MATRSFLDFLNPEEEDMSTDRSVDLIPPAQPDIQAPVIPNDTPEEEVFSKPKLSDILPTNKEPQAPMLAEASQQTSASETPLAKSERLLADYEKSLQEARKSDRMLKIGGALGDALATYLNAQGQMNVKAPGVQVQQGAGLGKVADMFATAPEIASDLKDRREALLNQYKQLASAEENKLDRALKERQVKAYEDQTKAQADKAKAEAKKDAKEETSKPSFEEKENIKANVKERVQEAKENRELKKQLEPAIDNVKDQIKNVKDALELINKTKLVGTGPLDQYFISASPEGQLLKKALGNISLDTLVQKFQGMSRAIDTETDRKFFQDTQPSIGNFETTNKKILSDILTRLEGIKTRSETKLKQIESEKQSKVENVKKEQSSNLVRIKGPSGEEATMTEENAKKYLNKPGYTRLK
jgi:hypothetical protein